MHSFSIRPYRVWLAGFGLAGALLVSSTGALAEEEHPNLKVLAFTSEKDMKKAMKDLTKGLGVKCTACHVKKDHESEKKPLKDKSRPFFEATVGVKDATKREKALAELLKLLEKDQAANVGLVWKGVDQMKKKG